MTEPEQVTTTQTKLFDQSNVEPRGENWLAVHCGNFDFPGDSSIYFDEFVKNIWRLLRPTEHWASIQANEIEAQLWLYATARTFSGFASIALEDWNDYGTTPIDHLRDAFPRPLGPYNHEREDDRWVVDALSKHFNGYGIDDAESLGLPDPTDEDPRSGHSWTDTLIDTVSNKVAALSSLLRTVVGPTELIINFYLDPVAWKSRLNGVAIPSQAPWTEVKEHVIDDLWRARDRLFVD